MPNEPTNEARLLWEVADRTIQDAVRMQKDAQHAIQDAIRMRAAARQALQEAILLDKRGIAPRHGFTREVSALLMPLLDKAMIIMGADMGNIQLVDPTRRAVQTAAQRGFQPPSWPILRGCTTERRRAAWHGSGPSAL
jgi:hypothetical protein